MATAEIQSFDSTQNPFYSASVASIASVESAASVASVQSTVSVENEGRRSALTTYFTPPPACTNGPWISVSSTQGTITCTRSLDTELCYPPYFTTSPLTFYSPGVCPDQYSAVATWWDPSSVTTYEVCCPSGMTYLQLASSCQAVLGGSTSTAMIISNRTTQITDRFTAFAPTIAVAWASSDLDIFTPASAPLTAWAGRAITTSPPGTEPSLVSPLTSTTSSADSIIPATDSHTSLLPGAKIGIGVGIAVACLAFLAVGAWLVFRRRMSKSLQGAEVYGESKAELPGRENEKRLPMPGELAVNGEVFEVNGQA
ncbi:hypothetical protein LTR17_010441 [Elasticomyces elasticus]|nr:hypothetical protein LTR17_010441 [Elasticomyces elasticus]